MLSASLGQDTSSFCAQREEMEKMVLEGWFLQDFIFSDSDRQMIHILWINPLSS